MSYMAYHEQKQAQEQQPVKVTDGAKTITLKELGKKMCDLLSAEDCDECPAARYFRHGHNGMIDFLRKVVNE